ncbi:MAG: chalcone isomerase family protein [Rhodocyclaceae bacterium]
MLERWRGRGAGAALGRPAAKHGRCVLVGLMVLLGALGPLPGAAAESAAQDHGRAHQAPPVPLPPVVLGDAEHWRPLGSGALRWLGFAVYRASLWSESGRPPSPDTVFALAIRYDRAISATRLVATSLDEMRRLGTADAARLADWAVSLGAAFPDVSAGDILVGVNRPGQGVDFYHRDALTRHVADPAFAQAFFAIWLDERTREPGLRAQLVGTERGG